MSKISVMKVHETQLKPDERVQENPKFFDLTAFQPLAYTPLTIRKMGHVAGKRVQGCAVPAMLPHLETEREPSTSVNAQLMIELMPATGLFRYP
jgi:hypothetical protein